MKAMKEAEAMTGKKDTAGVAVMKAVEDMEKVIRNGEWRNGPWGSYHLQGSIPGPRFMVARARVPTCRITRPCRAATQDLPGKSLLTSEIKVPI